MQQVKQCNDGEIGEQLLFCIRHRVVFLSEYIAHDHHQQITEESCERSTEIMEFWNQQYIQQDGNKCACNSDHSAIHVFVGELVPDAEIIINAQKNISHRQ